MQVNSHKDLNFESSFSPEWLFEVCLGGLGRGQRVSKQAGYIIIIKPDQRTGIKMRHGLTHNGCVEEFRGSKCGAHFRCVNNERLTPRMRQGRVFQPNQERMKTTQRHFQQAARTWKENKKSILYILYWSSEHPRSRLRRLPTFLFRKWSVFFLTL